MRARASRRFLGALTMVALLANVSATLANGEDGHQFPHIEQEDAMLYARWFLDQFADRGEIDPRWRDAASVELTAELLERPTGPEWLVTATDEVKANGRGDSTIELYFGPMGQFLGWEAQPAL